MANPGLVVKELSQTHKKRVSRKGSSMKAPIRLKKYGNRRIYDARRSGYVTLEEIRQMLRSGDEIEVVDAKSGDDLTRAVLVQIILEEEGSREALPTAFLTEVIRLADGPLRERFTRGLTGFLHSFWEMQQATQRSWFDAQREWQHSLRQAATAWGLPSAPMSFFANPFAALAGPPPRPAAGDEMPAASTAPGMGPVDPDEFRRLKEQLGETRGLLRDLLAERQSQHASESEAARASAATHGRRAGASATSRKAGGGRGRGQGSAR